MGWSYADLMDLPAPLYGPLVQWLNRQSGDDTADVSECEIPG